MRAQRFTTISPLNWMGASRGERHINQADVHHDSVIKRHVRRTEHGTHVRTRCKLAASTSHAFALLRVRRASARNMGHTQWQCSIGGVSPADRAGTTHSWRDMTLPGVRLRDRLFVVPGAIKGRMRQQHRHGQPGVPCGGCVAASPWCGGRVNRGGARAMPEMSTRAARTVPHHCGG